MEIRSLSKKRVSIKNIAFLQFLYPTYKVIDSLSEYISESRVIFTGLVSESNLKKLDLIFDDYIIVTEYGEIRLNSILDFITFYYPSHVERAEDYELYSLDDFLDILKRQLILRRDLPKLTENKVSLYSLYESMLSSSSDLNRTFLRVIEQYPTSMVISSVLTFLARVKSKDWDTVSRGYRALLNRASVKFGGNIDRVLLDTARYLGDDRLYLLNLLWSLSNG